MIKPPDYVKRFNSAQVRFSKGMLDKMLPFKDHLKPGQVIWNAMDIRTRADSKYPKFVPVILTLINEQNI